MSGAAKTLKRLARDNYSTQEFSELTGRSVHSVREELARGTAPALGQFIELRRWWIPKAAADAFMRSGEYTRWRGISVEELAAEYWHLERLMGSTWVRLHLMEVYGVGEPAVERAAELFPGVLASYMAGSA